MSPCKLCGSTATRAARLGRTPLVTCQACTITYLESMATEAERSRFYEESYRIAADDPVAVERRRLFRMPEQIALVATLSALRPPPQAVLDVGCDRGYFLDEMRRYGYDVEGIEPGQAARAYCARIGLRVSPSIDSVGGPYGIVTAWHTLEHVADPVAFVRTLFATLEPGGILAVRVPDFGCSWRKWMGERWVWFQPRHHCFHYTARALGILLESCGGRVLELRSRRPNDGLTREAWDLSVRTFSRAMHDRPGLRRSLGRLVEDVAGVELFAIAERSGLGAMASGSSAPAGTVRRQRS